MRFAPGTDPKVIAEAEKKWLSGQSQKPKVGQTMIPYTEDKPVRPDEPKTVQSPRQVRDQAIASAKDTRYQAMQAARAMKDRGQRLSAKQSALDAYANARNAAQQQYRASRTGISSPGGPTGGDMLPPGGMKAGGSVSASKRADGCAIKGKTRGRIV